MPDLRETLKADLATARKDRDDERVSLIRTLIAAIENAEAVDPEQTDGASEVPRRELTDTDLLRFMNDESADLRQAADHFDQIGHLDEAERLRSLSKVVDGYAELFTRP